MTSSGKDGSDGEKRNEPQAYVSTAVTDRRNKSRKKCALCQQRPDRRVRCKDCHLSVCPHKPCLGFEYPKNSGHGVCHQCLGDRRTAARPADVYLLASAQPQSDSSLSSDPRKPCHPHLMTRAPLAQAVVKLKDRKLLLTNPILCACQDPASCPHLTFTLSADSSSARSVFASSQYSKQESWNDTGPMAAPHTSHSLGTQQIPTSQEETPF